MSYRFVKVTRHYPGYLIDYYSRNPDIHKLSYQQQYDHMMADAFGWDDFYAKNLRKTGVDAYEIVANADPLQSAWAREHNIKKSGDKLLLEQLKTIKPDVILFQDAFTYNGRFVETIKKQIPSIQQVVGWCGSPYTQQHIKDFRAFNYMLTCNLGFPPKFERLGIRMYRINHAFEDTLLPVIGEDDEYFDTDVFFAGSINTGLGYHHKRKKILEILLKKGIEIQIHTMIPKENELRLIAKQGTYSVYRILAILGLKNTANRMPIVNKARFWTKMPSRNSLSKKMANCIRKPLYGINMLRAIHKAKIGFNFHIDVAEDYAGNARMFEVTGAGSCLVTDYKSDIRDFFEPDYEIVTYKSTEECVEKIIWLLDHPKERKEIAAAGQKRTLGEHTFKHRASELDNIIRKEMR